MSTFAFSNGSDYQTTGGSTSDELHLAARVGILVADFLGVPTEDLFIAGHEHEELSEGSASIAWEGGDFEMGWPAAFVLSDQAEQARTAGLYCDAINNFALAVWQER